MDILSWTPTPLLSTSSLSSVSNQHGSGVQANLVSNDEPMGTHLFQYACLRLVFCDLKSLAKLGGSSFVHLSLNTLKLIWSLWVHRDS